MYTFYEIIKLKYFFHMKIVYINPPNSNYTNSSAPNGRTPRWYVKLRERRVQRDFGIGLTLLSFLEQSGHQCKFIEGTARNLTKNEIEKEIQDFRPDISIIHVSASNLTTDLDYARLAKRLSYGQGVTVLVGAYGSALPTETLRMSSGSADIVVRGESEYTIRELVAGRPLNDILGISYWRDGAIIHNDNRPAMDINTLPFPSWKHIDPYWYHDLGKLHPFLPLYPGRGCSGQCTFCPDAVPAYGANKNLRVRDAKRIVDEMEYDLALFPFLREIIFEGHTFGAYPSHVEEVCREIIKRGLPRKIRWSCNVRTDIRLELLPLMKAAGLRMIIVQLGPGSNHQLAATKKGITIDTSRRLVKKAHDLGFVLQGHFIIGAPGETKDSAQNTINFAKELPLDSVRISGIDLVPGTEFYEWAKQENFISKDWQGREEISYPDFTKENIDFYIDKGLKEFYLRPRQMIRLMTSIRNWDDFVRKVYGIKNYFKYINKRKKSSQLESIQRKS